MDTLKALVSGLAPGVSAVLHFVWNLANSNFSTALFGAFAGAVGAQVIAARVERRRVQLNEIKDTGRALSLLFNITNAYLGLKGQYVAKLKDNYDLQYHAYTTARSQLAHTTVPEFKADLRILGSVFVPIEALRTIIFDKIGSNRAVIFMAHLIQSIEGSQLSIRSRNELAVSLRGIGRDELAQLYFGVPTTAGYTDTRYRDLVHVISDQVDDAIYFSLAMAKLLRAHGERFRKRYGKDAPVLPTADFSKGPRAPLIPVTTKYPDHENQLKIWADDDAKAGFRWS